MPSKTFTIKVADGARLVTSLSLENAGSENAQSNWTRKLNMRRQNDQERRREGWQKFIGATQYIFDGTESVMKLAELVRPNGDRVIVGAGRTKLKKYNTGTATWTDISGGLTFSSSGKRWQVATGNGYITFNNAVDLPVSYRVEDAAVTPLYELRQTGVCRVGRICEFNGFLMIGDITEIKADQLAMWMVGYSNLTQATNSAKVANFSIVLGDHQNRFDVTTGASTITATLPTLTFSQRMYVWIKKVDAGAGSVVTSPTIIDEVVTLTAINDTALVWWNGTNWVAKVFASGTIPAVDPYGTPPTSILNRLPWAVANSEYGQPTKWAPAFSSAMAAASTTVVLPFNPNTWIAKTTRVGVINGGPDGATLGGQTGYEDGVLVAAIGAFSASLMGVPITLEVTTDITLTYPRVVTTTRWTDISTIVARYLLTGDGSEITGLDKLGELLVVSRKTGLYVGRFTGDSTNPFVFVPRYQGPNVPGWGDCLANVSGDILVYPTIDGRFYAFDGISYPSVHRVCDDARALFFTGVTQLTECFVVDNPATTEVWFCNGTLVFAYDYEFQTVSEIDAAICAAAWVQKPGASDQWFILAVGRFVYTYGLVSGVTPIATWLRDEVVPTAILKSGLWAANLMTEEKTLLSYAPVLSSSSPDAAVEVQLRSTYNPSGALTDLLDPVESLPNPAGENYFACYFQAIFFQDQITLVDERDIDFRLTQRCAELDKVGYAGGVTRRVMA